MYLNIFITNIKDFHMEIFVLWIIGGGKHPLGQLHKEQFVVLKVEN
jgi:hypothetical protein